MAGGYPTFDPDLGSATPEAVAYSQAPAVVTFSGLGPLATIREEIHLEPDIRSRVLDLFPQHGIDYVSFTATQVRLPNELWPSGAYPQTWFEACFTYV